VVAKKSVTQQKKKMIGRRDDADSANDASTKVRKTIESV
jgi:hypothetical protein